jgi:hypothetical protein
MSRGVKPVVKYQHVTILQWSGIVLMSKLTLTPLPEKPATLFIDNPHGTDDSKTGQNVSIRKYLTGVGVGPFLAAVEGANNILLQVQVLLAVPFPNCLSVWGYFPEIIAPNALGVLRAREPPFDPGNQLGRDEFPAQHHGIAVGHTTEIMMESRLFVGPNHLAFPVHLHEDPTIATKRYGALSRSARHEQTTIFQQVAVVRR